MGRQNHENVTAVARNLIPLEPPAFRELGLVWRPGDDAPPVEQFRDFIMARSV